MNRITWSLIGVVTLSLGLNGWMFYKCDRLQTVVGLIEQKDHLHQQQMNDLTLIMYNRTNENIVEVAKEQGKIEGMLAIMAGQKPNESEANKIWHAGYYRGLEQAKDAKTGFKEDTVKVSDKTPPEKIPALIPQIGEKPIDPKNPPVFTPKKADDNPKP